MTHCMRLDCRTKPWLLGVILLGAILANGVWAQPPRYANSRSESPIRDSKIRITLDGRIVMVFDNYDIVMNKPLSSPLGDIDPFGSTPQIIYKGDTGMRWGGGNFFDHPAYHGNALIGRFLYKNRVINRGDERYPPSRPCPEDVTSLRFGPPGAPILDADSGLPLALQRYYPNTLDHSYMSGSVTSTREGTPHYAHAVQFPFGAQLLSPSEESEFAEILPRRPAEREADRPTVPDYQPGLGRPTSIVPTAPIITELLPIIIVNNATETVSYELVSSKGEYSFSMLGGERHEFKNDRVWQIRFDSQGWGAKTYRLRGGQTYQFRRNESNVWELFRQPQPNASHFGAAFRKTDLAGSISLASDFPKAITELMRDSEGSSR